MCRLRNIAMRDYQENVTTGQTHRQTDGWTDRQTHGKTHVGQKDRSLYATLLRRRHKNVNQVHAVTEIYKESTL